MPSGSHDCAAAAHRRASNEDGRIVAGPPVADRPPLEASIVGASDARKELVIHADHAILARLAAEADERLRLAGAQLRVGRPPFCSTR